MSAQTIEDGQSVPAVIIQTGSMLTKHSLRAVAQALGIPAATLAGLRDGSLVAVPREPDEAMLKAYHEAEARAAVSGKPVNSIREMNDDLCRAAWPAMLAASEAPK